MAPETQFPDFYAVLEIQFGASDNEVRRAWMQLVKQWQPKANSGDLLANDRLQQIHEAYGVLSDPEKRLGYDHYYKLHTTPPEEDSDTESSDEEPANCKSCLCGMIVIVAALAIVGLILWVAWNFVANVWEAIF